MKVILCPVSEVEEGRPVSVNPEGLPALAVYRIGEEYFVTDNLCTHGNAMLTDGYQEGEVIECPFHGGSFNIRSGKPSAYPCTDPLTVYRVIIEDGQIAIEAP
ncbi:MAG TPA: non-heme iron oxygenase ferredoxin subunit [Alphaproteobacteria bacterium]|jgi:ethylbenzene dioxygenase ferredoxin component|nr:non-heme iron oxygenase ferredoxin subunit [Alphaproteobacteria bacterium]